jgi:hypothetical protein
VVKGSDLLADYDYRPCVCLSDDTHRFRDEEALYAAITALKNVAEDAASYDPYLEQPEQCRRWRSRAGNIICPIPLYHST